MFFISIEGNEAAGKSTIIKKLKLYFDSKNISCFITREPGGTGCETSEKIRKILSNEEKNAKTELLLYMMSRNEHVEKIIKNKKEYDIVITDRFYHSSIIYQGYLKKLGIEWVKKINEFFFADYIPNLVIVLLIKPETSIFRLKNRVKKNYYDKISIKKHKKIYIGYKKIIDKNNNIFYINGELKIEIIINKIINLIKRTRKKYENTKKF